ncbi:hypothetical protein DPMN_020216 [Dreissena polymorpha]|uniref:Uncharacterized protein n=1 Tax=Dreissena polymorpha TaxID=45954 RepID=A0A9D4MUV7_DREPO|nr:hypothetical protein DPMN_006137 [Dreissena polymorpha]KAH3896045.1 hypothetical protein DPMN_020216 [Dreissena polymorpha]
MPMNSASCRGSRLASACLGRQMRSFAAKCDLPPHTEAASTAFSASTVAPCRRRSQICLHLATITTMSPIPEHRGERKREWSRIGVIVGERNGTWLNRKHRGHRDRF